MPPVQLRPVLWLHRDLRRRNASLLFKPRTNGSLVNDMQTVRNYLYRF